MYNYANETLGAPSDYDYYAYDDYDTPTSDVTLGGSTRFETRIPPRKKIYNPTIQTQFDDREANRENAIGFESFPFDPEASHQNRESALSKNIPRRPTPPRANPGTPLVDPNFKFPSLPPLKIAKNIPNATSFQDFKRLPIRNSLENLSRNRENQFHESHDNSNRKREKSSIIRKGIRTARPIKESIRYHSPPLRKNSASKENLNSLPTERPSSFLERTTKANLVTSYYLGNDKFTRKTTTELPTFKRRVTYQTVSRNRGTEPPVPNPPVSTSSTKFRSQKPSFEVRLNPTEKSVVVARPFDIQNYEDYQNFPLQNHNLNRKRDQATTIEKGIYHQSRNQVNRFDDPEKPSRKVEVKKPLYKLFKLNGGDERRKEIDSDTGLPYARNQGFDPSSVVYESDFRPVNNEHKIDQNIAFQVSSSVSYVDSKPKNPTIIHPLRSKPFPERHFNSNNYNTQLIKAPNVNFRPNRESDLENNIHNHFSQPQRGVLESQKTFFANSINRQPSKVQYEPPSKALYEPPSKALYEPPSKALYEPPSTASDFEIHMKALESTTESVLASEQYQSYIPPKRNFEIYDTPYVEPQIITHSDYDTMDNFNIDRNDFVLPMAIRAPLPAFKLRPPPPPPGSAYKRFARQMTLFDTSERKSEISASNRDSVPSETLSYLTIFQKVPDHFKKGQLLTSYRIPTENDTKTEKSRTKVPNESNIKRAEHFHKRITEENSDGQKGTQNLRQESDDTLNQDNSKSQPAEWVPKMSTDDKIINKPNEEYNDYESLEELMEQSGSYGVRQIIENSNIRNPDSLKKDSNDFRPINILVESSNPSFRFLNKENDREHQQLRYQKIRNQQSELQTQEQTPTYYHHEAQQQQQHIQHGFQHHRQQIIQEENTHQQTKLTEQIKSPSNTYEDLSSSNKNRNTVRSSKPVATIEDFKSKSFSKNDVPLEEEDVIQHDDNNNMKANNLPRSNDFENEFAIETVPSSETTRSKIPFTFEDVKPTRMTPSGSLEEQPINTDIKSSYGEISMEYSKSNDKKYPEENREASYENPSQGTIDHLSINEDEDNSTSKETTLEHSEPVEEHFEPPINQEKTPDFRSVSAIAIDLNREKNESKPSDIVGSESKQDSGSDSKSVAAISKELRKVVPDLTETKPNIEFNHEELIKDEKGGNNSVPENPQDSTTEHNQQHSSNSSRIVEDAVIGSDENPELKRHKFDYKQSKEQISKSKLKSTHLTILKDIWDNLTDESIHILEE